MYDSIDINEIDQIHINTTNTLVANARVLLDIRDKYEYIIGNIKNSVNIPYNYLSLLPENYLNKSSIYYIYCDSGKKSRKLCLLLNQLGYKTIDLIGGFQHYRNQKNY